MQRRNIAIESNLSFLAAKFKFFISFN